MSVRDVEDEIMISRAMASACATLSGAPVAIIRNTAGEAEKAAKQLLDMVKS